MYSGVITTTGISVWPMNIHEGADTRSHVIHDAASTCLVCTVDLHMVVIFVD